MRDCTIQSSSSTKSNIIIDDFNVIIIQSDADSNSNFDLNFRFLRYVIIITFIKILNEIIVMSRIFHKFCIDIDCDVFFIDRTFLVEQIFNYRKHVKHKINAVKIRDIENFTFSSTKYISIIFEVFDKFVDGELIIINFTRHVYIVDNLKIKMFINNDILDSKKMIIDLNKQQMTIDSCKNIITSLKIINRDTSIKRIIKINDVIKISVHSVIIISFKFRDKIDLSNDKNFMFVFKRIDRLNVENDIMFHIVDAYTIVVQVRNVNSNNVYLFKNIKLKVVQKYEKEKCYFVVSKDVHLTTNFDNHKSAFRN